MDHPSSVAGLFAAALIQSVAQAAPYLVIGYLIAAGIREYVPLSTLGRLFGERGVRPVLRAAGLGSLLPMCSCTVIPLGVGLVRGGAARGTMLSFLVTAPAISPVSIALSLSLLGPTITGLYVGVVVGGAILLGLIGNRLLGGERERAYREELASRSDAPAAPAPLPAGSHGARARRAGIWAFRDLGSEVSVDLVIGLVLAAAVLSVLPMGWISTWLGKQELATLFYVILIGIPVYTCSVPSLPVVQSLLIAGMSPGAAIAYLVAGPATNLGELLVLRRQMGGRATALFITGLAVMALGGGLIADRLIYADYAYQPSAVAGQIAPGCCVAPFMPIGSAPPLSPAAAAANVPRWHWPFVVVLLITVGLGLMRRFGPRPPSLPSGTMPVVGGA